MTACERYQMKNSRNSCGNQQPFRPVSAYDCLWLLMSKQIWAEEINAKGGLLGRPIKLVYYDDQTNAATVPGIYAKLIDVDKVDLLMGYATNLIVAAIPLIVERKKLVMVLLALGSNAEFKYPRYFQSAAFGPDSKGVLSNNFFAVAKSLAPEPKTVALVGADA